MNVLDTRFIQYAIVLIGGCMLAYPLVFSRSYVSRMFAYYALAVSVNATVFMFMQVYQLIAGYPPDFRAWVFYINSWILALATIGILIAMRKNGHSNGDT